MAKLAVKAPMAAIRPETELLLCSARTVMDAERAERIKALIRNGIDWSYLVHIASLHRLWLLLYRDLYTTCAEAVPQAILDYLRDHFHVTARHNLLLTVEMVRLLNLFTAHGIQAIPFKGPLLAALAYGNLGSNASRPGT